jgi:molybdate transport system substrate-binding protein
MREVQMLPLSPRLVRARDGGASCGSGGRAAAVRANPAGVLIPSAHQDQRTLDPRHSDRSGVTRSLKAILFLLLTLGWLAGSPALAGETGPLVAAATSLRDALPELAEDFAATDGTKVRLSFGASGNLRRQIAQGAPFDLFLSADEAMVLDLAREGYTRGAGAVYAEGRLAILVPKGSRLRPDGSLKDLAAAAGDGRLRRLAVANPEHAPYGRATREVLEGLGLWERLGERLVVGENVSQAAQFAATGAADAGIVAYSLALSSNLEQCCEQARLATRLHRPLRQRGALIEGAKAPAERLWAFILGPRGRSILERHGFGVPAGD